MPSGPKHSISDKLVADFETTTDPADCRVWAWGVAPIFNEGEFHYGNSIESFFDFIGLYNTQIYFHNLAFDGSFIVDWLLKHGFAWVEKVIHPCTFTTLISQQGKWYSVTVMWPNGRRTEFRDSLKKIPLSVKAIADTYKLDESKLEIDYDEYREPGHKLTPHEVAYLRNDVLIVAKAMRLQIAAGMTRLTVGADSLAEFKHIFGETQFKSMFPVLPGFMDADIRKAYRGGFTYADERYKGEIVGRGRVYDVNSLYPSVMYDRVLPYGVPRWFSDFPPDDPDYPLYIMGVTIMAKLKPGRLPCIQIKGNMYFTATEYQTEITEPTLLVCTNVDLALWQENYDLEILAYEGGWAFRGITGVFCEYIDKWMNVKANSTGGMRMIAKLHLNSLYGKFATNPDVTPRIPVLEDNVLALPIGPPETRDPVYTAVGVFITSYARDLTIRTGQTHYEEFLYADTDSLHLLGEGDPITLDVDEHRLGAWKRETIFEQAIYVRAKCYCEKLADGTYITHIAGLPETIAEQVTFEHFQNGHRFEGKLLPKRVAGGIVLASTEFTLNM